VSGSTQESTDNVVSDLLSKVVHGKVLEKPCDVRDPGAIQSFWDAAVDRFGKVEIWINNAGISRVTNEV
jgi:NAD(P)-dependent dehydrogenase (short-subunit alcohol dehydrogenase family)